MPKHIVVGFVLSLSVVDCANILAFFPTPSISHQVVFRPITQELAKRGHEVVVVTTDPAFPKGQAPPNLTEIDVHDISYHLMREVFVTNSSGYKSGAFDKVKATFERLIVIFEKQIQFEEVKNILRDKTKKFDLLILEACVKSALVLSHVYKAPVILVSSLGPIYGNLENLAGPVHPLLYPGPFSDRSYNYTLWDKITELWNHWKYQNMLDDMQDADNEMIRRNFGPNVPDIRELGKNVDMFFMNLHPLWDNNRPVPPNVVYIGGIHQTPDKELPKDLKSYLDSSRNGIIYVSFGSNVEPSMFPRHVFDTIRNVLSKLPYDVLWKMDLDKLPGKAENIKIGKWFPQSDLLKHPKVKLFITQGGLQSTDESIVAGVPFVGIPMVSDQWFNTDQYVKHQIGVKLYMETIDEEKLTDAITTVLEDDRYRQNIVRFRSLVYDQPQSPLDRAVWWTEHVLRHGGARHLRSAGATLTWSEYLEIPLIMKILSIIFLFSLASHYTIMKLYKLHSNVCKPKLKKM